MALIGTVGGMLRRAITQVNRILVKRRDSPGFSRGLRHHLVALGCVYLVMTRPITLVECEPRYRKSKGLYVAGFALVDRFGSDSPCSFRLRTFANAANI